jgi:TRAP-type C4-dicarboxylate transport system permease small subunit
MGRFAWRAFVSDERSLASNTPLWIPESLVAFGAVLLAFQLLARLGQLLLNGAPEDKNFVH